MEHTKGIINTLSGAEPEPEVITDSKQLASVEIFTKITDTIFSKDNIRVKTDLNDRQILAFSSADEFSKIFKIPFIANVTRNIAEYSISRNRKGRKEYESIAKASFSTMGQDDPLEQSRSIPARLMGRN